MKALSLTQPWATLVVYCFKLLETRGWKTAYRGDLAIHAAKSFPPEARRLCELEPFRSALAKAGYTADTLPLGAVVGIGRLDSCTEITLHNAPPEPERSFGNYAPGRYMFGITNATPLPTPIPARGMLGLWEWDEKGLAMSDDVPSDEPPTEDVTWYLRVQGLVATPSVAEPIEVDEDVTFTASPDLTVEEAHVTAIAAVEASLRKSYELLDDTPLTWKEGPTITSNAGQHGARCIVRGVVLLPGGELVPVEYDCAVTTEGDTIDTEEAVTGAEMAVRKEHNLDPDAELEWREGPHLEFFDDPLPPVLREWSVKGTAILPGEEAGVLEIDTLVTASSDEEAILKAVCAALNVDTYDLATLTWNDLQVIPGDEIVEDEEPEEPPVNPLTLLDPKDLMTLRRSLKRDEDALTTEQENLLKLLEKVNTCRNRIEFLRRETESMKRILPPEPEQMKLL